MIRGMRRVVGVSVVGWVAGAGALFAQANPGDVKHRNDCRLAAQILTLGQPANKRPWAMTVIGSCPHGAGVVPGLWESPPSDDPGLQALYHASIHAAAPEVFEAALSVAEEHGAAPPARLAALGTAVTYVRPDLVLYLESGERLDGVPPLVWADVWGTLDHPVH